MSAQPAATGHGSSGTVLQIGATWERSGDLTRDRVTILAVSTGDASGPSVTFRFENGYTATRDRDTFEQYYRPSRQNQ